METPKFTGTFQKLLSVMKVYYPVFLDVEGKLCLVVGGGQTAERKVEALLACGASVRVVARSVCFSGKVPLGSQETRKGFALKGSSVRLRASAERQPKRSTPKARRDYEALFS